MRMNNEGLINLIDGRWILENTIYEYIKPETLRSNWLYIEPMTRRRFLRHSAIPNIIDVIRASHDMIHEKNMELERAMKEKEIMELVKFYNQKENYLKLKENIINFHERRRSPYYISSILLEKDTIGYLEPSIHVMDTSEICPIGLDKGECESFWRQESGLDMYAYKDYIINDVKVRFHLSRHFKGLYYEIDRALSLLDKDGYKISFKKLVSILRNESILDVVKESEREGPSYQGTWEIAEINDVGIVTFKSEFGFLPIYTKNNRLKVDMDSAVYDWCKSERWVCKSCLSTSSPCYSSYERDTCTTQHGPDNVNWVKDNREITWWICIPQSPCNLGPCYIKVKTGVIPKGCIGQQKRKKLAGHRYVGHRSDNYYGIWKVHDDMKEQEMKRLINKIDDKYRYAMVIGRMGNRVQLKKL